MEKSNLRVCEFLFLALLGSAYLGCADSGTISDALQGEGYFLIRADARACVSPSCGGVFVSQLNASATRCADDVMRSECYVAQLTSDTSRLAERAKQAPTAIVKGTILPKTFEGFGNLGQISLTGLWLPFTQSDSQLDSTGSISTGEGYFSFRRDSRDCASPNCGGFFVSPLNASTTRCADEMTRSECYVAALTSGSAELAERANRVPTGIVNGKILPKTFEGFGNLGQISAAELWLQFTP